MTMSPKEVAETWNSFDFLTLYQQVDIPPQLAASTPAMAPS